MNPSAVIVVFNKSRHARRTRGISYNINKLYMQKFMDHKVKIS